MGKIAATILIVGMLNFIGLLIIANEIRKNREN